MILFVQSFNNVNALNLNLKDIQQHMKSLLASKVTKKQFQTQLKLATVLFKALFVQIWMIFKRKKVKAH